LEEIGVAVVLETTYEGTEGTREEEITGVKRKNDELHMYFKINLFIFFYI
jgi:hypothetical protein